MSNSEKPVATDVSHPQTNEKRRNPWAWIPTLYFAQGIPFVVVMSISVILFKRLGISNTDITLYTSWLYLPWVLKPLWSPIVDIFKTKRHWIIVMQLIVGAGLGAIALTIPTHDFFKWTLAVLWLLAFSSATHDIAADGFYMLGLPKHEQALFVGVRSTFFRLAMITGQGLLIILAGSLESKTGLPALTVQVQAVSDSAAITASDLESFELPRSGGEQGILAKPEAMSIGLAARDKAEIEAIIAKAKSWNKQHGFYAEEKAAEKKVEEKSWWTATVSEPLGKQIAKAFPREAARPKDDRMGNVNVVYLYLSQEVPADKNVIVNFGFSKGDKSIKLIEGERFTFNAQNWNQPFMAVIQLDPKLKNPTSATFLATSGNIPLAWSILFFVLAAFFLLICLYHKFILPRPVSDIPTAGSASSTVAAFFQTFGSFFTKPGILSALAFILLYRFAEAQLVKLAAPFMLDAREVGGLALSTGQVGFVYGTVGVVALLIGGLLGGFLVSRNGLKFWLPFMVFGINLPNLVYVYMAMVQPDEFTVIASCVALESFGYGFGFAAFMLYMIHFAEGEHKTAHYAICTGFMALGMMLPGFFSGWLQEIIGYKQFFVWIMLATIPSFIVAFLVKVDPAFGKKTNS